MSNDKQSTGITSGNLFWTLLLVLFIGLKLGGIINWSWFWVLAPAWIPLAFALVCLLVYLFCLLMERMTRERR